MAADITFGTGDHEEWVTFEALVVKSKGTDFILDNAARRSRPGGARRALVHDITDGLTINFNGDYPGGTNMPGVVRVGQLNLSFVTQGPEPELPAQASVGDMLFIKHEVQGDGPPDPALLATTWCSLWICVAHDVAPGGDGAWWQRIPLDDPVPGTA